MDVPSFAIHLRCDACGQPKQHAMRYCHTDHGMCEACRKWLNGETDTPPRELEEATRPKGK